MSEIYTACTAPQSGDIVVVKDGYPFWPGAVNVLFKDEYSAKAIRDELNRLSAELAEAKAEIVELVKIKQPDELLWLTVQKGELEEKVEYFEAANTRLREAKDKLIKLFDDVPICERGDAKDCVQCTEIYAAIDEITTNGGDEPTAKKNLPGFKDIIGIFNQDGGDDGTDKG